MRVLLMSSTFHPTIGGAETYALVLARGLGRLGHDVVVVTDTVSGQPDVEVLTPRGTIRRLHRYRERLGAVDSIFWEEMQFGLRPELHEITATFAPDVVLSNSLDLCLPAKLVCLATGATWVATFHEQAPEREAMGEATLRLAYGLLAPDGMIAGSRHYLERAQRFGRPERCHLIYHGIDTERFRFLDSTEEVRAHYGIAREHQLLVSAGRLKARKGFLDLLSALDRLVDAGREVSLVIAGTLNSGSLSYFEELMRVVRSSRLTGRVMFDHEISHDRMPWLLSGADVVVQASHDEGLGLAVIEALSCARALVATRIAGHTEILTGDEAVLVPARQPMALANAIASLLDDPVRRHILGARARARAVERFSVDRMTRSTEELLLRVSGQRQQHA